MRRPPFDKPWERRRPRLLAFGVSPFHRSWPLANAGRLERLRSQGAATLLFILLCGLHTLTLAQVRFTRGELEIPTYTFSRSETVAPLFKSADGAALYPYAKLDRDSMSRRPILVRYESLTLENEYLRVTLLPDLGGRIWSARDRVADREIFYTTSVIKPTTYNQRGGWPAGNLEVYGPYDAHMLTWPGEAWPWAFRRDRDGRATVILSHIDHFFRNKLAMEVTLRPGRSFIELKLRLRNDNALPNRYLLWTNAGVRATDGTRFIYPMTRTIAHVSSDIGSWPVAGNPGADDVDISWYKNNKSMLGVFGLDLYDNFIAAYDYNADYGTICYANRMLARGVKTWTWGTGEAAMRQMAHYTDSDGPYVEVQSGRFVWDGNYEFIEPGKSDGWTEYWYRACARHEQGYLELACEYLRLSALSEANRMIERSLELSPQGGPLRHYYRAYIADRLGDSAAAHRSIDDARHQTLALEIFPFRRETIRALARILEIEPKDANAACLFGEILYSRARRDEAIVAWRSAVASDPRHFSALRDLGLALLEAGRMEEALTLLNRAAEERPEPLSNTILVARLQAHAGNTGASRETLERALKRRPENDRLIESLAAVEVQAGNPRRALELLTQHAFEPKHQSYSLLHLWQVAQLMASATASKNDAIERVRAAQRPTSSLGLDDFATLRSARLLVFEALLHQAAGDQESAARAWRGAAQTADETSSEEGLFRAVALHKIGETARAETWLKNFLSMNERSRTSGSVASRAQAIYLAGIYAAFHSGPDQAREQFRQSLELDRTFLWTHQALTWLDAGMFPNQRGER